MTAMLLTDPWFEAEFFGNVTPERSYRRQGGEIEGAQGVFLWCPCGYGKPEYPLDNGRPHGILVPFSNPRNAPLIPENFGPVGRDGKHPRWAMSGTGLHDLTVTPSIAVGNPECWHGYITAGEVKR